MSLKNKSWVVGDGGERDDDCRYYGMDHFIIGYRFHIFQKQKSAINSYETAVDYINRIQEKTIDDLKLLEYYRERLREVIKNFKKVQPDILYPNYIFKLNELYKKLAKIWIEKIEPGMTVNGIQNKSTPETFFKLITDSHNKITGELPIIKSKWE